MKEDLFSKQPRMAEYLKPEDLDTGACITLASAVLKEQAKELGHAARRAAIRPSGENLRHLKTMRNFYKSRWFQVLSCGLADGEQVAKAIVKEALRGVKVKA